MGLSMSGDKIVGGSGGKDAGPRNTFVKILQREVRWMLEPCEKRMFLIPRLVHRVELDYKPLQLLLVLLRFFGSALSRYHSWRSAHPFWMSPMFNAQLCLPRKHASGRSHYRPERMTV